MKNKKSKIDNTLCFCDKCLNLFISPYVVTHIRIPENFTSIEKLQEHLAKHEKTLTSIDIYNADVATKCLPFIKNLKDIFIGSASLLCKQFEIQNIQLILNNNYKTLKTLYIESFYVNKKTEKALVEKLKKDFDQCRVLTRVVIGGVIFMQLEKYLKARQAQIRNISIYLLCLKKFCPASECSLVILDKAIFNKIINYLWIV